MMRWLACATKFLFSSGIVAAMYFVTSRLSVFQRFQLSARCTESMEWTEYCTIVKDEQWINTKYIDTFKFRGKFKYYIDNNHE